MVRETLKVVGVTTVVVKLWLPDCETLVNVVVAVVRESETESELEAEFEVEVEEPPLPEVELEGAAKTGRARRKTKKRDDQRAEGQERDGGAGMAGL